MEQADLREFGRMMNRRFFVQGLSAAALAAKPVISLAEAIAGKQDPVRVG